MAERKKTAEDAQRKQQLADLEKAVTILSDNLNALKHSKDQLSLLQSVSLGLYEEVDKLAKKAGADEVSALLLEQTNDVIRDVRALLTTDPYVQRYREFLPAGDNPQHRDVVVVLRQVRQALDRFASTVDPTRTRLQALLEDAKGVRIAVLHALEGQEVVSRDDITVNHVTISDDWMDDDEFPPTFDFNRLDLTDIPKYFSGEQ